MRASATSDRENSYTIRIGHESITKRAMTPRIALERYASDHDITYGSALRSLFRRRANLKETLWHLPSSEKGICILELAAAHIAGEEYKKTDAETLRYMYRIPSDIGMPSQIKASISGYLMRLFGSNEGKLYEFLMEDQSDAAMTGTLRGPDTNTPTSFRISPDGLRHLVAYLTAVQEAERSHTAVPDQLASAEDAVEKMDLEKVRAVYMRLQRRGRSGRGSAAA